jgi:hypothetical protein
LKKIFKEQDKTIDFQDKEFRDLMKEELESIKIKRGV